MNKIISKLKEFFDDVFYPNSNLLKINHYPPMPKKMILKQESVPPIPKVKEHKKMSEQEIYKSAIEKYGANHQMMMCVEEMSELTKELCKNMRGRKNVEQIAEEIADVTIMLKQMKLLFDCETSVCFYQDEKLQRLKKRIENEK